MDATSSGTVARLMKELRRKHPFPNDMRLRLLLGGQPLQPERKLSEYNVPSRARLQMLALLGGGGKGSKGQKRKTEKALDEVKVTESDPVGVWYKRKCNPVAFIPIFLSPP